MSVADFLRLQASRLSTEVTLGWVAAQGSAVLPGLLIVLAAALSMLPVPGVGNVTGSALVALAFSIRRGHRPLQLPSKLQGWKLSPGHAGRLLRMLAWLHETASRYFKPRASFWVSDRAWAWAAWPVAAMGVVIFLPIPLGNVFGGVSLVVLGMGHSVEDGLAVAVGWILSGLTLLYTAALTWGLTALGHQLGEAVARYFGLVS
jgi:hypothetical protein